MAPEDIISAINYRELSNAITHTNQTIKDAKPGTKPYRLLAKHLEKLIKSREIALGITPART